MSISFRGASTSYTFTAGAPPHVSAWGSVNITTPVGVQPGDLVIGIVVVNFASAGGGFGSVHGSPFTETMDTGNTLCCIFATTAPSSVGSSFGFYLTGGGNAFGSHKYQAALVAYYSTTGANLTFDPSATVGSGSTGVASTTFAAPTVTTTVASETMVALWAQSTSGSLTLPGGLTSRVNFTNTAGGASGLLIGDYTGPGTPGSSSPGSATDGVSGYWGGFMVGAITALPLQPVLYTPNNNAYTDLAAGQTFSWAYQATGPGTETGYSFRRKPSGGSYTYWNAGTVAFQSSDLVNTSSSTDLTFGAALWSNGGQVYNWSVASTDVSGTGPYASDFTVTGQDAPTVTVTAPTGTITTQLPVVTWTRTLAGGTSQTTYRVVTYNSTQYSAGDFLPGYGSSVDDSGVVSSASTSYTVATSLPEGVSYRSYVQIAETGNELSAWSYTAYSVAQDVPRTPTITATYSTDGTTGCPRITLAVTSQNNLLSTDDASFEGGLGTTTAITNCAVAQSTTQHEDSNYSLRMTSTASGNMSAGTATGLSGYAVLPSTSYTFRSDYWADASARTVRTDATWYDSSGTLISTTTGNTATDSTSAWTTSSKTASSPSNAAFVRLAHNVLSTGAGSEIHYVDEAGVFPGTVSSWTAGGFVAAAGVAILRSDGLYVRGASTTTPAALVLPNQTVTVYDYEGTPGTDYTYTAVVISGAYTSAASSASGTAQVPTALGFWELDPTDVTTAIRAQPVLWNPQQYSKVAAHPVLGQTTVNVVADVVQQADIAATFETFTPEIYAGLIALCASQKTIFISDPFGFSYYQHLSISPGGMGGKAHDTQLMASTAAGPHRQVAVVGNAQPRPAV